MHPIHHIEFQHNWAMYDGVIDVLTNFPTMFCRGRDHSLIFSEMRGLSDTKIYFRKTKASNQRSANMFYISDSLCYFLFETRASKNNWRSNIEAKFRIFQPLKFRGGSGDMSECSSTRNQPLTYCCRGAGAQVGS